MQAINDITYLIRLCVWPDGTYCEPEDLVYMSYLSDDFEIVYLTEEQYNEFLKSGNLP